MNKHKVKVLEEAFYKGAIRPVNAIIDYEGDNIPAWGTLASGQASTVKSNIPIENPVKPPARTSNKNTNKNKNTQTIITIGSLPDDKRAELALRANEAGITEDINSLTLEAFEAEILKRNEEKQLAKFEEMKTIAKEKGIEFEETEAPIVERIAELEEKINALNGAE